MVLARRLQRMRNCARRSSIIGWQSLSMAAIVAAVLASPLFVSKAFAQPNPTNPTVPGVERINSAAALTTAEDTRYKIGAGDVLGIIVRKSPELSMEAVRVDQRGMIRIPMVDHEVFAACRTENELATEIATLYLDYKKMPSVEVFVREFQSRPVAIIGAVIQPGQFRLQRRVRLVELISVAGGPSEKAGRAVNVIHNSAPNLCQAGEAANDGGPIAGMGVYSLTETLKGTEGSNPFVQPGDIISLPEADQVFIVGHVFQPRSIPLKDKDISVSRAIAMAGGPQRDANTSKIRIVRQVEGGGKQELFVDLKAIRSQRAPDIALLPNDIVEVGSSAAATMLNILQGAVAPAITSGAVRAIP